MHPREATVGGLPAHRSIADVPEPVELAVIAVPAESVVDVARECGAAGVRALVVLSAGFAEVGPRGRDRQAELLAVCRASGMRLVGPNCLGVLNTAPDVGSERDVRPGRPARRRSRLRLAERRLRHRRDRRGRAPRSRAVLVRVDRQQGRPLRQRLPALLGERRRRPTSSCCTWSRSATRAGSGRSRARVAARKPVVAVKSGRSAAGSRAATSHTGALLAASDATVDALFRHAGVIRTATVGELFDVAALLAGQPLPRGKRVGVVTNAGGPGIACADACEAAGLTVDPLPTKTRRRLARHLPARGDDRPTRST